MIARVSAKYLFLIAKQKRELYSVGEIPWQCRNLNLVSDAIGKKQLVRFIKKQLYGRVIRNDE